MATPPVSPTPLTQFLENLLAALRTAGALLVGNSALIYFGIVGTHSDAFWKPLLSGMVMFLLASTPLAVLERNKFARVKLESDQPKGK